MSRSSLRDLQDEHRELGVGPLLLGVLRKTVRDVSRDYSPQIYARSPTWDGDARDEVLQRWALERLIGGGALAAVMASCQSLGALHTMLRTSLRWHLASEHARGERSALARRLRKVLAGEPSFTAVGGAGNEARWTTADARPSRLDAVALASVAMGIGDRELHVVERPRGTRASPLLPTGHLVRLVRHILDGAAGSVAFGDLVDALALRFGILGGGRAPVEPADLADATDVEADVIEADEGKARQAVVASVVAGLGEQARETVVAWQGDPSFAHVGAQLGVHPSTVRSRLEDVFDRLIERGLAAGLLAAADDAQSSADGHMTVDQPSWVELNRLSSLLGDTLSMVGQEGTE